MFRGTLLSPNSLAKGVQDPPLGTGFQTWLNMQIILQIPNIFSQSNKIQLPFSKKNKNNVEFTQQCELWTIVPLNMKMNTKNINMTTPIEIYQQLKGQPKFELMELRNIVLNFTPTLRVQRRVYMNKLHTSIGDMELEHYSKKFNNSINQILSFNSYIEYFTLVIKSSRSHGNER